MDSSHGVMVDDLPVQSLLYADDLVLIARDRKDLQSQLDTLDKLSKSLKMEVNMGKTKVMLFQKQKFRAKSKKNEPWKISDKEVEECISYKCLGVTIKSNGIFQSTSIKLKREQTRPIFPLFLKVKRMGWFSASPFSVLI